MEADVLTTTPRITYGDLMAMGFLLGEFEQDAGAALRFCEEHGVAAKSACCSERLGGVIATTKSHAVR